MLLRSGILIKTKEPCSEVSDFTSVSFSVCLFVPFNFQAFLPPIPRSITFQVSKKMAKKCFEKGWEKEKTKNEASDQLNFLSKLRSFIFNVVASYMIISVDLQLFITL